VAPAPEEHGLRSPGGTRPRRRLLAELALPGLSAALVISGTAMLAAGCGTRQQVSYIPPGITSVPPTTSPAMTSAPATTVPRSVPVRIIIPAIGVDAPVMQLGLGPGKVLEVPPLADHNLAGWYDGGPSPGQPGPAVIVGHIDSVTGPSVFYNLRYLSKGDKIEVDLADGQQVPFAVTGLQQTLKTSFPTSDVYGQVPYPALRLVTCGGTFDYSTGHYLSSIIAYAAET
jgi:Sortase domain